MQGESEKKGCSTPTAQRTNSSNPEESENIKRTLLLIQVLQLSSKHSLKFLARVGELFTPHPSITDAYSRIITMTLSIVSLVYALFAAFDMVTLGTSSGLCKFTYGAIVLVNVALYLFSRTRHVQHVITRTIVAVLLYLSPFLIYVAYLAHRNAGHAQGLDEGGHTSADSRWSILIVSSFKFTVTPGILSAFLIMDMCTLVHVLSLQFAALVVATTVIHEVRAFLHVWIPSLLVSLVMHQVLNRFLRLFEQQLNYCYNMMMATSEAILVHRHGRILDVNPAFLRLFNYSYGESVNMALQDFFVHSDQIALKHEEMLTSNKEGKHPEKVIFECIGKTKTNEEIPLEIVAGMQEYLGEVSCVLGIRNIASRKDKDKLLMTQSEIHAKSRFLAIISHELKTPLNAISISGNLLAEDPILPDMLMDHVKIINKSTKHLLHTIKDILDFSKLEVGTLKLEPEFFDFHRCVEDVMDIIAQQAFSKDLEVAAYIPRDCPQRLYGDGNRFQQILANLLSNSIKFTDRGQVIVNIDVKEEQHESILFYVTVKDSGIGISEEDQKKLFRMFSQVDNSSTRKHGGTGLGLAICKQLVTVMGGNIGVISEVGKGATFWFTVRFAKPVASEQTLKIRDNNCNNSKCSDIILYGEEPVIEPNTPEYLSSSQQAFMLDLYYQRRTSTVVVEYLADANKRTVIMQGDKEIPCSTLDNRNNVTKQTKHNEDHEPSPHSSPIESRHPINGGKIRLPYVLILERNIEVAAVINRYVTSFGAEPNLVQDPAVIPTSALTKPISCVIIDENCFMGLDLHTTLGLIVSIKRQIVLSNRNHTFKPERPFIVLLTQGQALLEEQILLKFRNIVRKPVYLSMFERIFYNDLEAHIRNPELGIDDFNDDINNTTEYQCLESYAFDPPTLQIPALAKRHSRERIVVNFEYVDDGKLRSSITLSHRGSHESASSLHKNLSDIYLMAPLPINGTGPPSPIGGTRSPSPQPFSFPNTPKILCAEDQELNIKVIQKLLSSMSAEVEIATDGTEALKMLNIPIEESLQEIFTPYKYQVVLMDGNMPKMCGIETTRRIRQFEQAHNVQPIPIIGLTATDEKSYIEECIFVGMNEVITKPISKNKLFDVLSQYCPQQSLPL